MERDSRRRARQTLGQALLGSSEIRSEGKDREAVEEGRPQQHEAGADKDGLSDRADDSDPGIADRPSTSLSDAYNLLEEEAQATNDRSLGEEAVTSLRRKRRTSVSAVLRLLATGNTLEDSKSSWKLTRAVVHLEDTWKGRVSPCPALESRSAQRLFKLRWKYRGVDFLFIHLFLVLSLVEIPAWCIQNRRCFWSCYPDFTRNWHMLRWQSLLIEGIMLVVLIGFALIDVHVCGRDYWLGIKGNHYHAVWFKHGTLALYGTVFLLALTIDYRTHALCGYLRVLLYLSVHRRTMLVVTQLRHILGAVAEIWLLIFLNIVLFAWVGLVLYSGTAEGAAAFTDIFEACWRLFILFTTTNFPDIMIVAVNTVRVTVLYFVGFVMLNVFFLAPLSLAFIFNVFRGGQRGIPQIEEDIRANSSAAAFALLDDRGNGRVPLANVGALLLEVHEMRGLACREIARLQDLMEEAGVRRPEEPSLDLDDFKDAVRVMDRSLRHAEWITEIQWYYPRLYQSPGFRRLTRVVKTQRVTLWPGWLGTPRMTMLVLDFVDALFLTASFIALFVASSVLGEQGTIVRYDWVQIIVILGFCITTSLCAAVRGWHNCTQRPTWVFNVVVTIPSFVVVVLALIGPARAWGWRAMRALRVCHLSLVIAFVPRLGFLVRTLLIMTRRAATPASVLLAWAFMMAALGTQIFGGRVCVPELETADEKCLDMPPMENTYNQNGLQLLNFNDVPTALLTLFVLFVVNDWYVIVDEFVDVTGTGWARLFFIMNYIIGVAVILNLVITVVINSFWDEYKNTDKPSLALRQLHDAAAASARHSTTQANSGTGGGCGPGEDGAADPGVGAIADESESQPLPQSRHNEGSPRSDGPSEAISPSGGRARVAQEESGAQTHGSEGGELGFQSQCSAHQLVFFHMPPHVMPDGDQGGMEAERAIARRASRRRLDISGIS